MRGCLRILAIAAVLLAGLGCRAAHAGPEANGKAETCRADENGARIVADRGIGGTGISGSATSPQTTDRISPSGTNNGLEQLSDRGIGGTGISGSPKLEDDRGIGGTGIVGVITGFGSICLDGLEVTYDPNAAVNVDGSSESPDILRAGQLAVIKAKKAQSGLQATSLEIRHEVSGPVSDMQEGGKTLTVAGQRVAAAEYVWGNRDIQSGDWVDVSGFRNHGGEIVATRIDRRLPGTVMVRGVLAHGAGGPQIGALSIVLPAGMTTSYNQPIQLTGRYADGTLFVDGSARDLFVSDPAAYFGPETSDYVIDSYVDLGSDFVFFGPHKAVIRHNDAALRPGRTIMQLRRAQDGALTAKPLRSPALPIGPHSGGVGGSMPNRELEGLPNSLPFSNSIKPQRRSGYSVPSAGSGALPPFSGTGVPPSPSGGQGFSMPASRGAPVPR